MGSTKGKKEMTISNHAGLRFHERYPDVDRESFERLVAEGAFEFKRRQTRTRTVCCAVVGGADVYFIYSRPEKKVVTMLSPEQAAEWL
jgi:hypothetical protein